MQSWLTHTSRLANSQASASNAARRQWKTGIIGATKRSIVLKIHFVYLLINSSWFKNRKNLQPTKYITRKLNPIKHKKLFLNNVVWAIFGIEMLAKTLVNLANASLSRGKPFGGQGPPSNRTGMMSKGIGEGKWQVCLHGVVCSVVLSGNLYNPRGIEKTKNAWSVCHSKSNIPKHLCFL